MGQCVAIKQYSCRLPVVVQNSGDTAGVAAGQPFAHTDAVKQMFRVQIRQGVQDERPLADTGMRQGQLR